MQIIQIPPDLLQIIYLLLWLLELCLHLIIFIPWALSIILVSILIVLPHIVHTTVIVHIIPRIDWLRTVEARWNILLSYSQTAILKIIHVTLILIRLISHYLQVVNSLGVEHRVEAVEGWLTILLLHEMSWGFLRLIFILWRQFLRATLGEFLLYEHLNLVLVAWRSNVLLRVG